MVSALRPALIATLEQMHDARLKVCVRVVCVRGWWWLGGSWLLSCLSVPCCHLQHWLMCIRPPACTTQLAAGSELDDGFRPHDWRPLCAQAVLAQQLLQLQDSNSTEHATSSSSPAPDGSLKLKESELHN